MLLDPVELCSREMIIWHVLHLPVLGEFSIVFPDINILRLRCVATGFTTICLHEASKYRPAIGTILFVVLGQAMASPEIEFIAVVFLQPSPLLFRVRRITSEVNNRAT